MRAVRGGSPEIKEMLKVMEGGHGVLTREDRIKVLKKKLEQLFPDKLEEKEAQQARVK